MFSKCKKWLEEFKRKRKDVPYIPEKYRAWRWYDALAAGDLGCQTLGEAICEFVDAKCGQIKYYEQLKAGTLTVTVEEFVPNILDATQLKALRTELYNTVLKAAHPLTRETYVCSEASRQALVADPALDKCVKRIIEDSVFHLGYPLVKMADHKINVLQWLTEHRRFYLYILGLEPWPHRSLNMLDHNSLLS